MRKTLEISKKKVLIISVILVFILLSIGLSLYLFLNQEEEKVVKKDLDKQLKDGYALNYITNNTKENIENYPESWRVEDDDNDGIINEKEITEYNTNPYSNDSDGDGLSDYDEINVYKSNPNAYSSLGDGISDGYKVKNGIDIYKTLDDNEIYNVEEIKINNIMTIKPKNINYLNEYKYDIFTGTAFNKYTKIIEPFYLYSFKGNVKINLSSIIEKYNTKDFAVIYWDYTNSKEVLIDSILENNSITFDLDLNMYNPIAVVLKDEYDKFKTTSITNSKKYESRYISPNNNCDEIVSDNLYKTSYEVGTDAFPFDNFIPTNEEGTNLSTGICFGLSYTQMLRYNYKNNNRELNYDNVLGIPTSLSNQRGYNYSESKNRLENIFNTPSAFTFDKLPNNTNNGISVDGYGDSNTGILFNILTSFQTNQQPLYKNRMNADLNSVMNDLACSISDNQISNINYCYNYDGTSESCHSVNAIGLEKSSMDNSYRIYIADTNLTSYTKDLTLEDMPYILLVPYMDGKFIASINANDELNTTYPQIQEQYNTMNVTKIMINLPYVENEKLTYYSNSYNLNNVANNINKDLIDTTNIVTDTIDESEFIESGKYTEMVRLTGYSNENFRTTTSPDYGGTLSCRDCEWRGYWLNSNGWWMLKWWSPNGYWVNSLVTATANSNWPDSPNSAGVSAGDTWYYLDYIHYRNDWEKYELTINNYTYNAINLDLCGACSWSKERRGDSVNNRIDLYTSGSTWNIPTYGFAT